MVKIIVGNVHSKIIGILSAENHASLDQVLQYKIQNAKYMPNVKAKQWDGVIHLYNRHNGQSFYTGLLSLVRDTLKEEKVEFEIIDRRIRPDQNYPELKFIPSDAFEERDYQKFTIDRAIKFTRGVLCVATGGGKCLGSGTKVLMFDGSTKPVELIVNGDCLMGPDSKPRIVKGVTKGYGDLYLVKQSNGEDFVCNDEHILCLQRTHNNGYCTRLPKEIEITASNFCKSNKTFKHYYKGYKVGVEFNESELPIDPYWFGLWLGDGNSESPSITTGDKEIVNYLYDFAGKNKLLITERPGHGCKTYYFINKHRSFKKSKCRIESCDSYSFVGGMCRKHYFYENKNNGFLAGKRINPLKDSLRSLSVLNNKHIPFCYKNNSRENRLKLLAGLIDSDGNFSKVGSIEFGNSNKRLAEDVCWLARSLGFRSSLSIRTVCIRKTGYKGISYRVRISGKISDIPIVLKRKQAGDKTKYSALRYGISVEPIGKGDYFGFELDSDGRFLLGDFTVTHNTLIVTRIISEIKTYPFIFYVLTKDLMEQAHGVLSSFLNVPIGRIGDGEVDIKKITVCTIQTAVMALNEDNASFKISDYKYDDEDVWDEKSIDKAEDRERVRKLIRSAAGIYVDECHHASSRTVKEVMQASTNAFWRFGGSATPVREDGTSILIQASFGSKIVDINASYLIKKGDLVKPYIFMVPINSKVNLHSYQKIYEQCIVKNEEFNRSVADTANHLVSRGMSVLVLVQQYKQGEYLKKIIPNSEFINGKISSQKRLQYISDLRDGKITLIGTSLLDEGTDVKGLDAVIMAGGGKSQCRIFQRIGRSLRVNKNSPRVKDKAIVIVYEHNAKYLEKHAKRIKSMLKKEPEFVVLDSKGPNYINGEIDAILGVKNTQSNILDL